MRAAYRLPEQKGVAKLEEQVADAARPPDWLEKSYPSAAASLREGLEETLTINRLGLPAALRRCLGTTNLGGSPTAGVRLRTRRVALWRNTGMVLRWAAAAYLETQKHFRRIKGYKSLWMLDAALREEKAAQRHEETEVMEGDQSEPTRFLQAAAA